VIDEFTEAMELLRRRGFAGADVTITTRDAFDEVSQHLVASVGDEPVGMIRLTRGSPSVLRSWAPSPEAIPPYPGCLELTRGVVHDEYRQAGLYKLMMLESVLWASHTGARFAMGAVEPDFPALPFLESLGFGAVGARIWIRDEPRSATLVQAMVCPVQENSHRWQPMLEHQTAKSALRGFDALRQ
jgi:hypothetical protein